MKKIIYSMMALAFSATVFTSCEDVPAPYNMTIDDSNVTPTPQPTTDLNTEATAWTVAEAVQKIQAGQTSKGEAYVKGVISAVTFYDANHKSITYYLSDNGTDKTLQVFSGKGVNGADFAAQTDLQVVRTSLLHTVLPLMRIPITILTRLPLLLLELVQRLTHSTLLQR